MVRKEKFELEEAVYNLKTFENVRVWMEKPWLSRVSAAITQKSFPATARHVL